VRNLLRRALTVGLLAGLGTMTAAPAALASTTVEAYGIQATGLVTITRQPDATLSTPSPSNVATATVLGLLAANTLHAAVTRGPAARPPPPPWPASPPRSAAWSA